MVEDRAREPRQQPALLRRREPAPGAVARALRRRDRRDRCRPRCRARSRERRAVRRIDHRQRRRRVAGATQRLPMKCCGRRGDRRQRMRSVHRVSVGCAQALASPGGLELPRERVLVGARHIGDAVARRPQVDLEVQRNDAGVVDRELGRALQQRLALGVVDGRERILGQRVDLAVRIAAAVRGAEALVAVVGHQQRLQRRRRFAGARAPAEQHEAELEVGRLREERRRRHRDDLGVDADAREHLRDGLRDLGVVDVAVVRRMDREAEAVRIAGLGQQLLRAFADRTARPSGSSSRRTGSRRRAGPTESPRPPSPSRRSPAG